MPLFLAQLDLWAPKSARQVSWSSSQHHHHPPPSGLIVPILLSHLHVYHIFTCTNCEHYHHHHHHHHTRQAFNLSNTQLCLASVDHSNILNTYLYTTDFNKFYFCAHNLRMVRVNYQTKRIIFSRSKRHKMKERDRSSTRCDWEQKLCWKTD